MRTRTFLTGLAAAAAAAVAATVLATGAHAAGATTTSSATAREGGNDRVPDIARRFTAAWTTTTDTRDLARLYTGDGVYTDHAVGLVFRGREEIEEWESSSHQLVADIAYELEGAFRGGDGVVVQGVFSGHIAGAPRPFAVPIASVLRLRGNLIEASSDYYNRTEILSESGLPADWTPPAG